MVKKEIKEGNSLLFLLFIFSNFAVFMASLAALGCSIYLFALTRTGSILNFGFLITSLCLLGVSTYAFRLRKSIHMLGCYLVI